jgi:hypothetical protein
MNMAEAGTVLKAELIQEIVPRLVEVVTTALKEGLPIDVVERGFWDVLLEAGFRGLGAFLAANGDGDLGEILTLPSGEEVKRLDQLHARDYVSIFGRFTVKRAVYGSREGQAIAFVPLDNRLQLPGSDFSYVLQEWDQSLAVEQPFAKVNETIERMLKLRQSVDSLEGTNRQAAADVAAFRDDQPAPPAAEEGQIVVLTGDCKGVVIRGQGSPTVCGGERPGGQRANQKRMATVGAVYTVEPHVRTAADVVAALFRDPDYEASPRPEPCHKHVWASLPIMEPQPQSSIDVVFEWLGWEEVKRNGQAQRPTVHLCDGQEALWQACAEHLCQENTVPILDLLHVTPRLWQAGKLLYGERSGEVVPFVRQRLMQVLEGKVENVIRTVRRLAKERKLPAAKRRVLGQICRYLSKNRQRMRYDEYLQQGYPIASGVIEGACRHVIKDRMERAGMHWTVEGAQAMLDLRSVYASGQWEEYWRYRIESEREFLYPYRELVVGDAYFAMAG